MSRYTVNISYTSRYTADRYMPDNEVAQNAMTLTFFHWGFHAWIVYALVGMTLAFVSFRCVDTVQV